MTNYDVNYVIKGEEMKCPNCGYEMSLGVSHDPRYNLQYECHNCGHAEVKKEEQE